MVSSAAPSLPLPLLPASSRMAPGPSQRFVCTNADQRLQHSQYTKRKRYFSRYLGGFSSSLNLSKSVEGEWDPIPALRVGSFTKPVKDGVLCKHILVIERSYDLREQLHQLGILIALNLYLVHQLQLKLPIDTESIQKLSPCLYLFRSHNTLCEYQNFS